MARPFSLPSLCRFFSGSSSIIPGKPARTKGRFILFITIFTAAFVAAGESTPSGEDSGVSVPQFGGGGTS